MFFRFLIEHYRLIILIFLVCFFGYLLLFSQYGYLKKSELIDKKMELLREIHLNLKIQDSLKQRINELMYDTTEIEKVARKLYGYVKEGELIYVPKKKASGK